MPNAVEIVNQLFPNLWIFIAHVLATISLLVILSKLVYTPFKEAMRKRREGIKSILISANKTQDIANKKAKENSKILKETLEKVSTIIKEAQVEADSDKDKIIKQATEQSNEIINEAKKSIISENKKNNEKAKEIISKNSIFIASKILQKQLNEVDHKKIIDNFISNVDLNGDFENEE